MKLYTEEQVIALSRAAFIAGQNQNLCIYGEEFKKITPIELPNDEQIKESMGHYDESDTDDEAFLMGAKWMREKTYGGNK